MKRPSLLDQWRQPPDNRIRYLLLGMAGLIAFLIFDAFNAHTSSRINLLKTRLEAAQREINAANALIDQIPVLQETTAALEDEIAQARQWRRERIERLQECGEDNLLSVLQSPAPINRPLTGFSTVRAESLAMVNQRLVEIDFKGPYLSVLPWLDQFDQSICNANVKRWLMRRTSDDGESVAGSLTVSIFTANEERP